MAETRAGTRQNRRGDGRPPPPLTEGQRLLRAVDASLRDIADETGVAFQLVSCWRRGSKAPGAGPRAKLEAAYGIPVAAWGMAPGGDAGQPVPPPAPKPVGHRGAGKTLVEVVAELDYLHGLRDDPGLLPAEKVRLSDSISKNLALKARLERDQELLDDRIAREHPTVIRATKALLAVVEDHPEVAGKLEAALAQLVGGVGQ
jgi:transcriptional regulator with XRE-family HTH domain